MPDRAGVGLGTARRCRAAVLWIDWYAYHLARFRGLQAAFGANGEVVGVELVGGVGVHAGLTFREGLPTTLPVHTLFPGAGWAETGKLALARAVWRKLGELDPELVLVPGYYNLPAVAAALWARLHRRRSVLMTESTAFDHTRRGWKELLKGALLRLLFDAAVTGGSAHRSYLRQLGFPAEQVRGFYDVVDNRGIASRVRQMRSGSDAQAHGLPEHFFLFVGRLSPEKNADGLLRAWIAYRSAGGTWPLVLVGDGPEATALAAAAKNSAYARDVHFAGHKSSGELAPFQAFASCFVLPSTREPWGLVVNEAMAANLPVIVSGRCGCAEDLVAEDRNGFIFDPSHTDELTACLRAMEALPASERERMGAISAKRIAAFSPENFGAEVRSLLEPELRPRAVVASPAITTERVA